MNDDEHFDYEELSDDEESDSDGEGIKLCTKCPTRPAVVTTRLKPLGLLAQQGIPCLIVGEDALVLVFWVPTAVSTLHIVVADAHRDRAVEVIASSLLYERFGREPGPGSIDHAIPLKVRSNFANSMYLKAKDEDANPPWIIIHPETFFGLNVGDFTRSTPVDVFPGEIFHRNIRLPQPQVMVDAIIDTLFENGRGLLTINGVSHLSLWLAYTIAHGFRVKSTVPGEGQDAQELLSKIKVENQEYFRSQFRLDEGEIDLKTQLERRKAIKDLNAVKINKEL